MSLALSLRCAVSRVSTHESVVVGVELANRGTRAIKLPYLGDAGAALVFGVSRRDGGPVRMMSDATGQAMMSTARVDVSGSMLELPGGESWAVDCDLGKLHHLLPAGDFALRARYAFEPEGVELLSNVVDLNVSDAEPTSVQATEEHSILSSLLLVISTGQGDARRHYFRQHALDMPFASWIAREIEFARGADRVGLSVAASLEAESADAFVTRHVLWTSGRRLSSALHLDGSAIAAVRQADLPEGFDLLPVASHAADFSLTVFLSGGTLLRCVKFGEHGLETEFELQTGGTVLDARRADETSYILAAGDKLRLLTCDPRGGAMAVNEAPLPPGLRPLRAAFEPRAGIAKVLYADTMPATTIRAVVYDDALRPIGEQAVVCESGRPKVVEASFDANARGRIDLLTTLEDTTCIYVHPEGDRIRLFDGQASCYPYVVSGPGSAHLGLWRRSAGFRFIELRRKSRRFVSRESL